MAFFAALTTWYPTPPLAHWSPNSSHTHTHSDNTLSFMCVFSLPERRIVARWSPFFFALVPDQVELSYPPHWLFARTARGQDIRAHVLPKRANAILRPAPFLRLVWIFAINCSAILLQNFQGSEATARALAVALQERKSKRPLVRTRFHGERPTKKRERQAFLCCCLSSCIYCFESLLLQGAPSAKG